MSRCPKNPLRPLLEQERRYLSRISGSQAAAASHVARAKALLAVAQGLSDTKAAYGAGRRSGEASAALVARFNDQGLAAVVPRHGGGQARRYTAVERERVVAEARRVPDREQDGTAVWSLSLLQRVLRKSGLSQISTYTNRTVLLEAGLSGQQNRSWCATGTAQRRGKRAAQTGVVTVTEPDAEAKKN